MTHPYFHVICHLASRIFTSADVQLQLCFILVLSHVPASFVNHVEEKCADVIARITIMKDKEGVAETYNLQSSLSATSKNRGLTLQTHENGGLLRPPIDFQDGT